MKKYKIYLMKSLLAVVFALILYNVSGQAIFKNEILDSLKKENIDTIALFNDHCTYMMAYVGQCPLFIQWKKNGNFFICRYMDKAKYEIKKMDESSTQIAKYIQLQNGLKYDSLQMTKLHKNDRFTQYPCDDCTSAYSIAYILGCRQVLFQIEYIGDMDLIFPYDGYYYNKTILQNLLKILKDTRKQINKYFKRPEIEGHYDY